MSSVRDFVNSLRHVEELISRGDDSVARRFFNEDILTAFDPDQLDDDVTVLVYELDRYFNDVGLRELGAPVTEREYILESFKVLP